MRINTANYWVFLIVLTGCASLPNVSNRQASYAFPDTQDTILGQNVQRLKHESNNQDGFLLLGDGLDAFVARAVLAEAAQRSLDVQYYIYHDDLVGRLFSGFLIKAADRGVRVRILVDDMDMDGRDADIIALDAHPNIEVQIFNPFDRDIARGLQFVTGFGSVTRRMHNKSFVADNQMAILGGRNIGNEYFAADPVLEFADLDVLAAGDIVKEVSSAFDQYWNSELAYPATVLISERKTEKDLRVRYDEIMAFMEAQQKSSYMSALRNSDLAEQLQNDTVKFYPGDAVVVVDHPEKITSSRDANELHLVTQLSPYFENIENELIMISPYFVPGDEGIAFFEMLVKKGVHVKILTNSLASNDVSAVHAGYSRYRNALLRGGVELYELNKKLTQKQRKEQKGSGGTSKASLHAKTFVIDRKQVFIGSLNLDPRSFYENSEIGLVLKSAEIAEGMADWFDNTIEKTSFRLELVKNDDGDEQLIWHGYEDDEPVIFEVEPYAGFWRRFGVGILRMLPGESQL